MGTFQRCLRRQSIKPSPLHSRQLSREQLNGRLMALYNECPEAWTKVVLPKVMLERYGVDSGRDLTVEQLADLVDYLRARFKPAAGGAV
jgi:hypothetical protein